MPVLAVILRLHMVGFMLRAKRELIATTTSLEHLTTPLSSRGWLDKRFQGHVCVCVENMASGDLADLCNRRLWLHCICGIERGENEGPR
jgi:hypothetical protein